MKRIFLLSFLSFIFLSIVTLFLFVFSQKVSADHACNESCGTPPYCNSGLTCTTDNICRNPNCLDRTDCTCKQPNCKNVSGQTTVVAGDTYQYSATYENGYGVVDKAGMGFASGTGTSINCSSYYLPTQTPVTPGASYSFNWTPITPGAYTVFCDAWNDAVAECKGACNNGSSNPYACAGPNSAMIVNVVTPTLYPTVAITGVLKEYTGAACYPNISSSNVSINISPQSPAGVTPICGVTPATGDVKSSYNCTVVFDNQNARPTPAQNLTLNASATNYQSAYWTDGNACTNTVNNTLSVNVAAQPANTVFNKDIFFNLPGPWIKLKNTSYLGGNLTNIIPYNISSYDGDDNGTRYFIINDSTSDPGLVAASSINLGTAPSSSKGWQVTNYSWQPVFNYSTFFDYVKSRKQYKTITALSELTGNTINFYQGDLTITDQSNFNNKKVVLIVSGTVTFNLTNFQPTNASTAILASTISFSNSVQSAKGLFIADTINTGQTTDQGLKINGNLTATTFNNQRKWIDNSKPSVFIIFNPSIYLDLLPYLSIDKYDWQQLQ